MRVKVRPSFLLYLSCVALLASGYACLGAILALLVHETAHLAVSRLLGERIETLELTPFGGVMTCASGSSALKGVRGLAVAAAGPAGNYLAMMLLTRAEIRAVLPQEALRQMLLAHAAMLTINLLPALPLDGGRMVFSLGYYVFGVSGLIALLTAMGMAAGVCFIGLGIYGAVHLGMLNVSLLIVGAYLLICAATSRRTLLAENLYAVIQERQERPRRIARMHLYTVPQTARLITLVEPIERSGASLFCVEDAQGKRRFFTDSQVLAALLARPQTTAKDLAAGFACGDGDKDDALR